MFNKLEKELKKIEEELSNKPIRTESFIGKLDAELIYQLNRQIRLIDELTTARRVRVDSIRKSLHLIFSGHEAFSKPPKSAEFVASLFIPMANRDAVLGDLEESYHRQVKKFGERKAKILYWVDVVRSIWPFVSAFILKLIKFVYIGFFNKFSISK